MELTGYYRSLRHGTTVSTRRNSVRNEQLGSGRLFVVLHEQTPEIGRLLYNDRVPRMTDEKLEERSQSVT